MKTINRNEPRNNRSDRTYKQVHYLMELCSVFKKINKKARRHKNTKLKLLEMKDTI